MTQLVDVHAQAAEARLPHHASDGRALRVLYVTADPPSPIRRRSFELIRALRRAGHEVTVACLVEGEMQRSAVEELRVAGVSVVDVAIRRTDRLRSLARGFMAAEPLQKWYAWHPAMARRLEEVIRSAGHAKKPFDVAHVEHLRALAYGLSLPTMLPVVWDSVDCISFLFEQAVNASAMRRSRWITRFELARTRREESRVQATLPEIVVCSPIDREALLRLADTSRARCARISVVPNCVDLAAFSPPDDISVRRPDELVMTGKMSYHANETAALRFLSEVMPLVWQERPSARLVIAGASPTAAVQAAAARATGDVEVTGRVEQLAGPLRTASVAVAPVIYGAGTQYKVLEAMACATPVVASPVAVRALDVRPGRDLLVGEDPAGMARGILSLLAEPKRAADLGRAGRAFVAVHHDWDEAAGQLNAVHVRAIAGWQGLRS